MNPKFGPIFVIVLLSLTSVVDCDQPLCPSGWIFGNGTHYCYYYGFRSYNWQGAQDFCVNNGGNLASIGYLIEKDQIRALTKDSIVPPWIGTFYNGTDWKNIDGTPFSSYWAKGEPNRANGDCLTFRNNNDTYGMACAQCYNIQPALCKQPAATCNGGNFGGSSIRKGNITSPNYPNTYYNNLDCQYFITSPSGTYITINFDPFITESVVDYVSIFDGFENITSKLIAKVTMLSGKYTYESTGNQMLVWFHTDWSVVKDGWAAYWEARTISTPINVTGSSGELTSPNYPSDYPTYAEQLYFVTATDGFQVGAYIDDFKTEKNRDQLLVYDGLVQTPDKQIANLSGYPDVAPWSHVFSGNTFSMRFYSDGSIQYKGFHLTWNLTEH